MNATDPHRFRLRSTVHPVDLAQIAILSPAELFEQIGDHSNVFWFDSAENNLHGWSYLGLQCNNHLHINAFDYTTLEYAVTENPSCLSALRTISRTIDTGCAENELNAWGPHFRGGWVGYLSYDLG